MFVVLFMALVSLACGGTTQTGAEVTAIVKTPQGSIPTHAGPKLPTATMVSTEISKTAIPTEISATAIPTEIPASPTPAVTPLEILSSQGYADSIGFYHVIGEVRNNTSAPMGFVEIVATLYDDSGGVTGTSFTYSTLEVIPPAGKSPFDIIMTEATGTTKYKLQVQGNEASLGRQDLVIAGESINTDAIGFTHIQGEVQNTGSQPATFVELIGTIYDADGNVVGVGFTYTTLDTIPAGGASPFDLILQSRPGLDHYEIQVQGE